MELSQQSDVLLQLAALAAGIDGAVSGQVPRSSATIGARALVPSFWHTM